VNESASALRKFLGWLMPPPADLFEVAYPVWTVSGAPPTGRVTVTLRDGPTSYGALTLCGHSLGGLVLRHMVREDGLLYERRSKQGKTEVPATLTARLRLFAPAIGGARPAGLPGLTLELGGIGALVRVALGRSPSYKAMTRKSELLPVVRTGTEQLAVRHESLTGFQGEILWPAKDDIVEEIGYDSDVSYEPTPEGTTHTSVCKPRSGYPLPLEFVLDGVV
jgi:hypothetical protein